MTKVTRIEAVAELEDPTAAVELATRQARDGRDSEFEQLVEEWRTGRVLVVRIDVRVELEGDDGAGRRLERATSGVWLERDDRPHVETQVQEVVPTALEALADDLRAEGIVSGGDQLLGMFVHVELGPALRARLDEGS